ncbi:MAG: AraC family transcriptional regulator of adaptative response / DNA-3-methyladenine glycosylase II [Halieaceae bacterium]|jgi:AraC family transcriptional regulator of adaptative response / DNA-3-methyladenine glycosylase II
MDEHNNNATTELDREICRQARLSRDRRFDGEFFLAVSTTGIYCRPICPARQPAERNVVYFRHAAQAAQAGFRPCLRCRPETTPNSPAWLGTHTTVSRALDLIRAGALNGEGSLDTLAARMGIGERYLRKLFQRDLGLSPLEVAQNQRLLLAKQLLAESTLPLTNVAFAAGFNSVRRFNSAVRSAFNKTPGELRKNPARVGAPIELELHYRPPYDWQGVMGFFYRHAVPGVEQAEPNSYQRNIRINGQTGHFSVTPIKDKSALKLSLSLPALQPLMPLIARVRRMFDLDANPEAINAALSTSPILAKLLAERPGIRVPGAWSAEESAVRAVIGQQVSTAAACSISARFARACTRSDSALTYPRARDIAKLGDDQFPMPGSRRDTLRRLGELQSGDSEEIELDELAALRGVGPWTTNMTAMRGLGEPDVFPAADLGLINAWQQLGRNKVELKDSQNNWRPWRSYAANLLWRSLSP